MPILHSGIRRHFIWTALWIGLLSLSLLPAGHCIAGEEQRAAEPPELRPQYDLDRGFFRGTAVIDAAKSRIVHGQRLSVRHRFTNTSGGTSFYNPFFSRLIQPPAKLAVFDAAGGYVGDMLTRVIGSRTLPGENAWTFLPGGAHVGNWIVHQQSNRLYTFGPKLAPGTYRLQLIYLKRFLVQKNDRRSLRGADEELFRSNIIEVTIVRKPVVVRKPGDDI